MTRHGTVPLLQDYLTHAARLAPAQCALVCGNERVTYGTLEAQSNALANVLVERGVARGDRVMVYADNRVETVVAFWAALKANAVVTLINPLTKADKLGYLIRDCRPSVLIAEDRLSRSWLPALCEHVRTVALIGSAEPAPAMPVAQVLRWEDALAQKPIGVPPASRNIDIDLAAIVYTSGSTGEPKGVMLTHRNMLTAATSISSYLALQADDVIFSALPLAFDYGLYQMILSVRAGARLVLERSFAFPAKTLKLMKAEGVTGFPGVPTMFALLAELKGSGSIDLPTLRFVTNTAAALSLKHISALRALFPDARIYSMYGLTECKRCTYLPPEDLERKPTSVGIAIPNTELWIVDDQGRPVGPDVVGQLVIRGATVMKGYWEKPEATAERLKPGPVPGEQVLWTGDLCRLDRDGYLYFVGRMDDIIKSRGEKVAPKEVEAVLLEIEGVKEAAVIGVPDDILGQAVKAFVVLEHPWTLTEKQLLRECTERLESLVPKVIQIVASLPRTDTGKIKKTDLHRHLTSAPPARID